MDKFLDVFKLLYLTAKSDHKVTEEEIGVLSNYIQTNYDSITFDPDAVASEIEAMPQERQRFIFEDILENLKDELSASEKQSIMLFVREIIRADKKIVAEEKSYAYRVIKFWDLDDIESFEE